MLRGIGASPGVAIGKAFVKGNQKIEIIKKKIDDVDAELVKLDRSFESAKAQVRTIGTHTLNHIGQEEAKIFEAHLMMLEDTELFDKIRDKVRLDHFNAEWALKEVTESYLAIFESMDNDYMRERATDLKDITGRVLRILQNIELADLSKLPEKVIIVAEDLTPSDTATMDKTNVIGFLTDLGGQTSHSSIMARIMGIPAVVGLKTITESAVNGDIIAFNGETGEVVVNPDEEEFDNYTKNKEEENRFLTELQNYKGQKTVTLDGREVELFGNIGTVEDMPALLQNDAEGIGLFRTEFVYMNRDTLPSEEEQYASYKEVLEMIYPKPVVIRTLDIGGDKELSCFRIKKEMNPFLGYRAIRLCLKEKDIFKTQLRALMRAGVYGNLKIMFPMISSLTELLAAKKVLKEVEDELDKEGVEYSKTVEVGMMIEIPSAAVISDILAKHVDFFSIGTNDLIQYTCAVDRMNEEVQDLYDPYNPAVLRLINTVIENGHKAGIWVGMCGELAGDKRFIPILIGMGLDEFSMSSASILPARKLIRELNYDSARALASEMLRNLE